MKKLLIFALLVLLTACGPKTKDVILDLNPGLDTVEINATWEDAGVLLVQEEYRHTYYSDDVVDTSVLGIVEVVYTIFYNETTYEVTRYVTIADQTAPIPTLQNGIDTISVNGTWMDAGCLVTDNSGESLICTTTDTVDTSTLGTYYITYHATDSSGNTGTIVRVVTVIP